MSVVPMHGKQKDLGTGLVNRIKEGPWVEVTGSNDNDTILVSFPDFPEAVQNVLAVVLNDPPRAAAMSRTY